MPSVFSKKISKSMLLSISMAMTLSNAYGQSDEKEESHSSFVAIRVGANLMGNGFNEDNFHSPAVIPNFSAALEGAWLPHKNIGFMLSAQFHQLIRDDVEPFRFPNMFVGQTRGNWNSTMILTGLFVSKPLLNWDLEGRLLSGPAQTKSFDRVIEQDKSPLYRQTYTYSGYSWWHQIGISARIDLKPGLNLGANFDYSFSKFSYSLVEEFGGQVQGTIKSKGSTFLSIPVVSFTILYSFPHFK